MWTKFEIQTLFTKPIIIVVHNILHIIKPRSSNIKIKNFMNFVTFKNRCITRTINQICTQSFRKWTFIKTNKLLFTTFYFIWKQKNVKTSKSFPNSK